jgi:hypothetical protein
MLFTGLIQDQEGFSHRRSGTFPIDDFLTVLTPSPLKSGFGRFHDAKTKNFLKVFK